MAGSLGATVAGCALIMLVGMSSAGAATGRIAFSGAVVEATCSTDDVKVETASRLRPVGGLASSRLTCGQTSTDPGPSYSRTVISLDAATIANDRLLDYFAGYANVESVDGAKAKLVVRTYE